MLRSPSRKIRLASAASAILILGLLLASDVEAGSLRNLVSSPNAIQSSNVVATTLQAGSQSTKKPVFVNSMNASLVLGQTDYTSFGAYIGGGRSEMSSPDGMAFDKNGDIWVADDLWNRVLEFKPPFYTGMNASLVIGFSDFFTETAGGGEIANQSNLYGPTSVAFDPSGNLWVSDSGYGRVLEFTPPFSNGMKASLVVGCNDSTPLCLGGPIAFDPSGDLWAVGSEDNGVLNEFRPPFTSGMNASLVFGGMSDMFNTIQLYRDNNASIQAYVVRTNFSASGIAFDKSANLWISDDADQQILEFQTPFNPTPSLTTSSTTGTEGSPGSETTYTVTITSTRDQPVHDPIAILGKTSQESGNQGNGDCEDNRTTDSSSLCFPSYLAFDEQGSLWVTDYGNHRVLGFKSPSSGSSASIVIGETNFTSANGCSLPTPTAASLCYPKGLAFDSSGNLWVADYGDSRVLRYGGSGTIPCVNNAVPYLSQADPAWGSHRLGNSTNPEVTFGQKGCALTSAAMLLSYIANKTVSPVDLNDWLGNHSGYDKVTVSGVNHGNYNLIWAKVAEYARKVLDVQLYYGGSKVIRNDTILDQYLSNNFPVITGEPGHWILVTCKNVSVGGYNFNFTYDINDPGHVDRTNLNNAAYKNTYQRLRLFSTTVPKSDGSLTITAHSPVDIAITDPLGRITDSNTANIPDSDYDPNYVDYDNNGTIPDPSVPALELITPMSGTYTLKVTGTGEGNYTLDFLAYDSAGNSYTVTLNGNTTAGKTQYYSFDFTDSVGGSEINPVPTTVSGTPAAMWYSVIIVLVAAVVVVAIGSAFIIMRRNRKHP